MRRAPYMGVNNHPPHLTSMDLLTPAAPAAHYALLSPAPYSSTRNTSALLLRCVLIEICPPGAMQQSARRTKKGTNLRLASGSGCWRSTRWGPCVAHAPLPAMLTFSLQDYVLRAKDFNSKKQRLKALQQKATTKNPDEFYFQMHSSSVKARPSATIHYHLALLLSRAPQNGVHRDDTGTSLDVDQVRLFKSQDANYVHSKLAAETNVIHSLILPFTLLQYFQLCGCHERFILFDQPCRRKSSGLNPRCISSA